MALRVIAGLLLVGGVIYTGFVARSPWIILPLAIVFTVSHAAGRWRLWERLVADQGVAAIIKAVSSALVAQLILVGLLYLIGYGLGALIVGSSDAVPFGMTDIKGVALLGFLSIGIGALLSVMEPAAPSLEEALGKTEAGFPTDETSDEPQLDLDPTPITPETFFTSPYHGHKDPETGELKTEAKLTDDQIAAEETRLGITLPPLLKQLYQRQNGGGVGWMFVPLKADPKPISADWRGAFSIDYCDLTPLTDLGTMFDAQCAWLDPDDDADADEFVENAKQIIPLSMRYMDCTVLDYSQPGPPRAGIVDYDGGGEPDIWFETFEDLFAALRRERDDD